MKSDVLSWLEGQTPPKRPSKETLNHTELIALVSGCDPHRQTPEAYRRAYAALGIDIINNVPEENAPTPLAPGEVGIRNDGTKAAHLGVFNTTCRTNFPFQSAPSSPLT